MGARRAGGRGKGSHNWLLAPWHCTGLIPSPPPLPADVWPLSQQILWTQSLFRSALAPEAALTFSGGAVASVVERFLPSSARNGTESSSERTKGRYVRERSAEPERVLAAAGPIQDW